MKNKKEIINFIKGTSMFINNFNNERDLNSLSKMSIIELISLGAIVGEENGISFSTKMVDGKLN